MIESCVQFHSNSNVILKGDKTKTTIWHLKKMEEYELMILGVRKRTLSFILNFLFTIPNLKGVSEEYFRDLA